MPKADLHPAGIIANTSQFNGTGHPALSIPMGVAPPTDDFILSPSDKDIRLPVGLQARHFCACSSSRCLTYLKIVGNLWDEGTVYRVADAWERSAGDWRQIEAEM